MDEIRSAPSCEVENGPSTSKNSVRRRETAQRSHEEEHELDIERDLFPEFENVLDGGNSVDDESEGCPLPGTPEEESLMDPKVVF